MFLDFKIRPLDAVTEAAEAFGIVAVHTQPILEPEPLEAESLGNVVKENAFALNNISKKRKSFKAFFGVIVFMVC